MTSTLAVEHGTIGTYQHRGCRCDKCRRAWSAYQAAWRKTPKGQDNQRRLGRIHSQAKTILKHRHKAEYDAIVAELREATDA